VSVYASDGVDVNVMLLAVSVYASDGEDVQLVLQHSNPYFPLRFGDKGDIVPGLVTHIELPNLVSDGLLSYRAFTLGYIA
jgi:hypothetical protein